MTDTNRKQWEENQWWQIVNNVSVSHSNANTSKIIPCQWSRSDISSFSLSFESLFCQFSPGCSVGEWQLPNSTTNYQQHFTITRGNTRSTGSHPPLTVAKTPGRLKLFCQRKMLINHTLTPGSSLSWTWRIINLEFLSRENSDDFLYQLQTIWDTLKKSKLALSHNQSQLFTGGPKMQLHW